MPSKDRAQDRAEQRKHDRAERQERILDHFEAVLNDVKYPVAAEELRAEFRDAPDEVVGEEESLGSVLDRLDDQYRDADEAREAIVELLGEAEHATPESTEREERVETRRETGDHVDTVDGEGR
jgi:hypothetical protein